MGDYLEIPVANRRNGLTLIVYPQSSKAKVFEENDPSFGESRWQLVEGEETEAEYKNVKWDIKIKQMISDGVLGKGRSSAEPRGISMAELIKYVIKN